jgi:phospholipid/cholesterol/gamma-HCH transport system ATP-binding protein
MTLATSTEPKISVRDLVVGFGERTVLDHVSIDIHPGNILGLVGGSGSGKSVMLRTIIGLLSKRSGRIALLGRDQDAMDEPERHMLQSRYGVLFQHGALFSSLTVLQNVQFPMREFLHLPEDLLTDIAATKLAMVGLSPKEGSKFPSELSGGMTKRVALARALALDPELVFLDEPTSGLDPISAGEFDSLIRTLQQTLGLTVFMVTHDLNSLHTVCDRIAVLAHGRIVADGTIGDMLVSEHPWVKSYFRGPRGQLIAKRLEHASV